MKKLIVLMVAVLFVSVASAQTRTAMKTTELKKDITDHFAKTYPGYVIKNAFKVETNKVVTFEVIAAKEANKITLVYNDKGVFVKEEKPKPTTHTTTKPKPTTETKPAPKPAPKK